MTSEKPYRHRLPNLLVARPPVPTQSPPFEASADGMLGGVDNHPSAKRRTWQTTMGVLSPTTLPLWIVADVAAPSTAVIRQRQHDLTSTPPRQCHLRELLQVQTALCCPFFLLP